VTHLSEHFTLAEAACKCGCPMPPDVRRNAEILAEHLEVIRLELGKPLVIRSWYRCPDRNKAVGGAPKSLHLTGAAVDLNCGGFNGPDIAKRIEGLIKAERIPDGGLGAYASKPNLCHFDVRTVLGRKAARWSTADGE
jgi:uncharacterized protein YcbK (DUF882 family)